MEYILQTDQLTKLYGSHPAVDHVSLTVRQGDIYGFVGKNGAGKTTFMRVVLGLTEPDSGSFSFMDGMPLSDARRKTGSLIEHPALFGNMSARENLRILCTILKESTDCIQPILQTVGLSDTGKKKVRDFSLGMKQRLGIGMALVGDPQLLMLDEPINGLDPTGIVEIRELLLKLHSQGKTIFISSHLLGELEKIATRYGIIAGGRLVEELTAEELKAKANTLTYIRSSDPEGTVHILRQLLPRLKVEIEGQAAVISGEIENIGLLTNELFKNDIAVTGISTSESGAEKYFIKRMEENQNAATAES